MTIAETLTQALKLHQTGDLQQAKALYRKILQQDPKQIDALHLLGLIAHQSGNHDLALEQIQQALELAKQHKQVKREALAAIQNNLAEVYRSLGQIDQAADYFGQAIRNFPRYAEAYNNLGVIYQQQGNRKEAIAHFKQALRLKPDTANAALNLGNIYRQQGDFEAAIAAYQQALEINPQFTQAINNLGNAYREQRQLDQAEAMYQRVLEIDPDYADTHVNLGLIRLLQGDYPTGWSEYEWRWKLTRPQVAPLPLELLWDGSELEGKSILLFDDQGTSNTLQMIRYVPFVIACGGKVTLQCQSSLVRLFKPIEGIQRVVESGKPLPTTQLQASVASLPHLLGTTLETIPNTVPYLTPPDPAAAPLQLPEDVGFKVGLAWGRSAGGPKHTDRYCPPIHLLDLTSTPGTRFFALQRLPQFTDPRFQGRSLAAQDVSPSFKDLADTAALVAQLDLVITVDAPVAHLAGALGKPVWVMLPYTCDWPWLLDRDDSPWYPTMRLFRQAEPGVWSELIERVQAALVDQIAQATE